jgi:hypothetical protein
MKNYGDVVTMMTDFLHSIEDEKSMAKMAADAPTPGPNDDAKTEPEGHESKTVPSAPAAQGAAGKEKQQDVATGTAAINADSPEAVNTNGDGKEATDDQGPKMLDASQKVTENITVEETPEKIARAERLGNSILSRITELQKNASEAAPAAPTVDIIEKLASENPEMAGQISQSYHDFTVGWLEGHAQRQQDAQEMAASGLFKSAAEADAMLDQIAAEDPAAVAPPGLEAPEAPMGGMGDLPTEVPPELLAGAEGGEAAGGDEELDPEAEEQLSQLADEMAAAGVQPEDLVQAAQQLQELTDAGVSPEEIIQAAGEVAQEGPEGAEEAPEEDVAADITPEEVEKAAHLRHESIKDYIRSLNQA